MITIKRNGTKLVSAINPGMSDNRVAELEWQCGSAWYAELLVQKCEDRLYSAIKQMRQDAYNEGWKDKASHKRAKKEWFSGQW